MFLAVLQSAWQSVRHGKLEGQPELSKILQESLAVEAIQHGIEIKSTWSTRQAINNINGTLIDCHTHSQTSVNFFLGHPVAQFCLIFNAIPLASFKQKFKTHQLKKMHKLVIWLLNVLMNSLLELTICKSLSLLQILSLS